jgi:hypothetical protein
MDGGLQKSAIQTLFGFALPNYEPLQFHIMDSDMAKSTTQLRIFTVETGCDAITLIRI